MNADTRLIERTVRDIGPLLHGLKPEVQGAVICDLLAIWLAGHTVGTDADLTREMRADLLENHLLHLRDLVDENARSLGTAQAPGLLSALVRRLLARAEGRRL